MIQYRDRLYLDPNHPPDVEVIDGEEVTFEIIRLAQMRDAVDYLFRAMPNSVREGKGGAVLYRHIECTTWKFNKMEDIHDHVRQAFKAFKDAYKSGDFINRFLVAEEGKEIPRHRYSFAWIPPNTRRFW